MRAISSFTSSTATSELRLGTAKLALKVSKRARRLRLRVDARTRSLVLTVPRGMSQKKALAWAETHRAWAEQALGRVPEISVLEAGATILLFGRPHRIETNPGPRRVTLTDDAIIVGGPVEGLEARLLRWLRAEALALLMRETAEFADKLGRSVARVSIGDPKSRWGSCSSAGTIRYSWRLIMAPDHVRRATVAHEVAHLVHMDHSPRFHALHRDLFGEDPRPARLWLKRHGAALHQIG